MTWVVRIAALAFLVAVLGAASYLGYQGRGGVSSDLQTTSVRTGSGGGVFVGGARVK